MKRPFYPSLKIKNRFNNIYIYITDLKKQINIKQNKTNKQKSSSLSHQYTTQSSDHKKNSFSPVYNTIITHMEKIKLTSQNHQTYHLYQSTKKI